MLVHSQVYLLILKPLRDNLLCYSPSPIIPNLWITEIVRNMTKAFAEEPKSESVVEQRWLRFAIRGLNRDVHTISPSRTNGNDAKVKPVLIRRRWLAFYRLSRGGEENIWDSEAPPRSHNLALNYFTFSLDILDTVRCVCFVKIQSPVCDRPYES